MHASGKWNAPLVVINQVSPHSRPLRHSRRRSCHCSRSTAQAGGLAVVATPNSGSGQAVRSRSAGRPPQCRWQRSWRGRPERPTQRQSGDKWRGGRRGGRGGRGTSSPTQLAALVTAENGTLSFIDNAVDTTTEHRTPQGEPSRIPISGCGPVSSCPRNCGCSSSRTRWSSPRRPW